MLHQSRGVAHMKLYTVCLMMLTIRALLGPGYGQKNETGQNNETDGRKNETCGNDGSGCFHCVLSTSSATVDNRVSNSSTVSMTLVQSLLSSSFEYFSSESSSVL